MAFLARRGSLRLLWKWRRPIQYLGSGIKYRYCTVQYTKQGIILKDDCPQKGYFKNWARFFGLTKLLDTLLIKYSTGSLWELIVRFGYIPAVIEPRTIACAPATRKFDYNTIQYDEGCIETIAPLLRQPLMSSLARRLVNRQARGILLSASLQKVISLTEGEPRG